VAALGIAAGCCVHIVAAGLGLSALLATSAVAFTAVKLAGAAYLIYMGIVLWRTGPRSPKLAAAPMPATSLSHIFVQGALTNILNPRCSSWRSCRSSSTRRGRIGWPRS
jgi:threonine/homoserine/homoserine lactone efflux protein